MTEKLTREQIEAFRRIAKKDFRGVRLDEVCDLALRTLDAELRIRELEKDAERYRWLQDWYLREGKRSEIYELGHIRKTTVQIMDSAIDAALAKGKT